MERYKSTTSRIRHASTTLHDTNTKLVDIAQRVIDTRAD